MRILRHEIEITDYQTLRLPARGELLSVAKSLVQPDRVIDWAGWSLPGSYSVVSAILSVGGAGTDIPERPWVCDYEITKVRVQ